MTLKLAKNLCFWGIDINVFMGDLSTYMYNTINHELNSEPSFQTPQLYLLSHTLRF